MSSIEYFFIGSMIGVYFIVGANFAAFMTKKRWQFWLLLPVWIPALCVGFAYGGIKMFYDMLMEASSDYTKLK